MQFDKLYEENSKRLWGSIFKMTKGDHGLTDDISQSTWEKVYKSLRNFKGHSSPYTWIYRIALNTYIDHVQKESRHTDISFEENPVDSEDLSDPMRIMSADEISDSVRSFLDHLTEQNATLLTMYLEGVPYQKISDYLGTPLGTIKSKIHRMIKEMKSNESFVTNIS